MKHRISPHISRLFPVRLRFILGRTLLWSSLSIGIYLNIMATEARVDPSLPIQKNNPEVHIRRARAYFDNGQEGRAHEELVLADRLAGISQDQPAVLGASSLTSLLATWKENASSHDDRIAHWHRVTQTYPEYQDGYIQLATLLYEKGDFHEAYATLLRGYAFDPTQKTMRGLINDLELVR